MATGTHKDGKWARQLLESRNEGLWGACFHTLSQPASGKALTTEQAIRRLRILGFTREDEAIQTVLTRMCQCVNGERRIDGYSEKMIDWPLFERLMLSAWIRLFDPENETGLCVARQWAAVAVGAFEGGRYSREGEAAAFAAQFGRKPKSAFETGFGMFYHAALLRDVLPPETENLLLAYWLARPEGMYYIYQKPLCEPPATFSSLDASRYLAAIEVLADYGRARENLAFVAAWLEAHRCEDGRWDMGAGAKDGIYLPLSDSWRTQEARRQDCTERISRLLDKINR